MAAMNQGKKKPLPIKWIALGILAAAAILLIALIPKEKPSAGEAAPLVHSAGEAISFLESKGEDLGYENALSELTEVHSATVSGDSYYRLQQNFQGIPVYGRTVVYAADENGTQLTVTQNIRDIPSGLSLTPTVGTDEIQYYLLEYLAEAYPESSWAEALVNEDITAVADITPGPESLCIYTLDGPAHLAYEIYCENLCILADAHTGQVLREFPTTVYDEASFQSTGETLNVGRMDDGTYVLKDEDTGTYIYTADHNTYCDPNLSGYNHSSLILVTSEDSVFGAGTDSVSRTSMETARKSLERVNHIRQFYDGLREDIVEKLILVYDDALGSENGENAFANRGTAIAFTGSGLFDASLLEIGEKVGLIGIGTVYSADPVQYADIYAHEYTHLVSRILVDWVTYSGENGALNEAYSDIFGELYEGYMRQGQPDWLHGVYINNGSLAYVSRNLIDPQDFMTYPTRGGLTYPKSVYQYTGVDPHLDSTIISHIAYRLWAGDPSVSGSSISSDDLATLWFKSMLLLPSDADFHDCRTAVTEAAAHMGLSEAQQNWIAQTFDDAGIRDLSTDTVVDFHVQDVFTTDIWDADGSRCTDCEVTVRKAGGSYGPILFTDDPIVWRSSDSERCHLALAPGLYTMTVQVGGEPEAVETFDILVSDDSSAEKEIGICMNQGKSMLDIGVSGNADGKEAALPGAVIEIYRDNPNTLVFFGTVGDLAGGRRFYLTPDRYTVVATAWGYAPAQVTLDMQDTSVHYSHSFLLESTGDTVPEGFPTAPEEISGGAPYRILNWEYYHSGQTDGVEWTNRFCYDYIALQGDDPAYEAINRDLYSLAAETMHPLRDTALYEPQYDHEGIIEHNELRISDQVVHNGNGIISILTGQGRALTYSLYNGAPLGLHILAGDFEYEYLQKIRQAVYDSHMWHSYVEDVAKLNLDDFAFLVMDGEIVILGIGCPGRTTYTNFARMVHTGLYVSTEYTDRLKGTMRATGGTGSASYEIQELDNSFRRLGAPACLQVLEHTCEYPIFSGAPACGAINQEVHALAEQFMDGLRDGLTRTSNRFEFSLECNPYCENENVSYKHSSYAGVLYNANGILSYVMNWRVLLMHYVDGQHFVGAERYDGLHGTVYNLETGEHLTLQQITGMDDTTQLLMLKDAYGRIYNNYFFTTHRIDYDPSALSLTDPEFVLAKDGQIILHFSTTEQFSAEYLEDMPKSVHIFETSIPTGMYVLGS